MTIRMAHLDLAEQRVQAALAARPDDPVVADLAGATQELAAAVREIVARLKLTGADVSDA